MTFVKVAKTVDVPTGKMKHLEANGKEIMIANVEGKFYAIDDRCALVPLHFSRFDVTTGKLISGPKMMDSGAANMFAKCPVDSLKHEG